MLESLGFKEPVVTILPKYQCLVQGEGGEFFFQNLWSSWSAGWFLWVNWLLTSEIPVSQMGIWNKACLVRTKAVLLQWIITLANLIIPSGTQHRPNAAWIMEAGSYFQLCSIDFWQVWSYRWLNFSTMIREFSAKESLEFLEVGMGQLFSFTLRFACAFSPFYFYSEAKVGFFVWAELSFRSGMREVIDVMGNCKLYNAWV